MPSQDDLCRIVVTGDIYIYPVLTVGYGMPLPQQGVFRGASCLRMIPDPHRVYTPYYSSFPCRYGVGLHMYHLRRFRCPKRLYCAANLLDSGGLASERRLVGPPALIRRVVSPLRDAVNDEIHTATTHFIVAGVSLVDMLDKIGGVEQHRSQGQGLK